MRLKLLFAGESVFLYLRAAAHDPPSRVNGLLNTTVRPPKLADGRME